MAKSKKKTLISVHHLLFAAAALLLTASVAIFGLYQTGKVKPLAAACPFADNDANDAQDTTTGVYEFASSVSFTGVSTAYDCTGITTVIVPTGVTVTFAGDTATGNITAFDFTNLQIENGGVIEADTNGCVGDSGTGNGPDASNICINNGNGAGQTFQYRGGGGGHGGTGGNSSSGGAGGGTYDSSVGPLNFGASGGGAAYQGAANGGTGGGVVRIDVSGTLTHNGLITADGGNGSGSANARDAGGGAGGSIYITAGTLNSLNNSGTYYFSASGGSGTASASHGGGGGAGGMVAIEYASGGFTFNSGDFDMAGGTGPNAAQDGQKGTVYVKNTSTSRVDIFHGFGYANTSYSATTWYMDASATNQYCATGAVTPSVTAANLTLAGSLNCSLGTVTSFNYTATSSISLLSGVGINVTNTGSTIDISSPASSSLTFDGATVTGSVNGSFTINDAVAVTLTGNSTVTANTNWTNLTSLTIDPGSTISANVRGCVGDNNAGNGPDGTNTCIDSGGSGGGQTFQYRGGGGGHGGVGGNSSSGAAGGITYDSSVAPVFYGASGGGAAYQGSAIGGTGGGTVRIDVSGAFTHNGVITADGGTGSGSANARDAGGGAGGSIYITAGTLNSLNNSGTFYFSASGGDGTASTSQGGGGGGGGMVAIEYGSGSFTFDDGDFDMSGGAGPNAAQDGQKGTAYTRKTSTSRVDIFHGFGYANTGYTATTWYMDDSATNQYCATGAVTPSITAANLTLGGTLNCSLGTVTSFNFSASSDFEVAANASITVSPSNSTVDFNMPGSDSVTFDSATFAGAVQGSFTINDAADISLTNGSVIAANTSWTNLNSLTIANGATISANTKGCTGTNSTGYGPNSSNVCTLNGSGAGQSSSGRGSGAGHGGAGGGAFNGLVGGTTYDSATEPVLIGASGGGSAYQGAATGGTGGGLIRIDVDGIFTHSGTISADGGNGSGGTTQRSAGGGSGGSIYITATEITCSTGTFSAAGGNGTTEGNDGGGGGGGRISVNYITDGTSGSCDLSSLSASALTPGGTGYIAGSSGTFYENTMLPEVTLEVGSETPTLSGATAKLCDGATSSDNASISACSNISSVILTAGSTKTVSYFIQASDNNGVTDLASTATGVFYHNANASPASSSCSADNNNCYVNSGTCTKITPSINTLTAWYRCDYDLEYYTDDSLDAASWAGYIQIQDGAAQTASDGSYTTDVSTLAAVTFPDVTFGVISLPFTSSDTNNIEITHTNSGNVIVDSDVDLAGSGLTCSSSGSIPVSNIKFDLTDVAWGSMSKTLTANPAAVNVNFDIAQRTNDSAPQLGTDQKNTYWGIQVLSDALGLCSGSMNVTVYEGP